MAAEPACAFAAPRPQRSVLNGNGGETPHQRIRQKLIWIKAAIKTLPH